MIKSNYKLMNHEVFCDKCSNYKIFENVEGFADLLVEMKKLGWKIIKTDLSWDHLCPVCGEGK